MAEAIGWTDAARHLRHYLSGTGDDLTIDPSSMMRDAPGLRSDVDDTVRAEIGNVSQQAIDSGEFGTAIPFRSDWKGYYIKPGESQNWFYANGGIQYSTSGTVTVQPPSEPGGQPHVSVDYEVHVWDRYNWDGGKSTQIGPITVTDEQMAALQRAGLAREYDTTGSSAIMHYEGPQPDSSTEGSVLPTPDNRDGQRSDPTRDRQSLGN